MFFANITKTEERLEEAKEKLIDNCGDPYLIVSYLNITKYEFCKHTTTLTISKTLGEEDTTIHMCETFVDEYDKFLYILLLHEFYHHALAHLWFNNEDFDTDLLNVAMDVVINLKVDEIKSGSYLWEKMYPIKEMQELKTLKGFVHYILRPNCLKNIDRADLKAIDKRIVEAIKNLRTFAEASDFMGVYYILVKLFGEHKPIKIILLGSHPKPGEKLKKLPGDIAVRIANHLEKKAGLAAGHGINLEEEFRKIKDTPAYKKILELIKPIMKFYEEKQKTIAPRNIPRRATLFLAAGFFPTFYEQPYSKTFEKRATIYLDVSGSITDKVPVLYGIVKNLSLYATLKIFLFSNKVVPITIKEIKEGRIRTTYGTDFDCVAESIFQDRSKLNFIVTDGYATMEEGNMDKLRKLGVKTLGILVTRGDTKELKKFCAKVVHITEADFKSNER